jgi:hypothetical protein
LCFVFCENENEIIARTVLGVIIALQNISPLTDAIHFVRMSMIPFVVDLVETKQKLAHYLPRVEFNFDVYLASLTMSSKVMSCLCIVFRQLSLMYPSEFFEQMVRWRRVCRAFWKFFFSATAGDRIPLPPLRRGLDLEQWTYCRVNPVDGLNYEFTSAYTQWFYMLMTNAGGERRYRVDLTTVRWLLIVDNAFILQLIMESGVFKVSTNPKAYHFAIDSERKYSLWPPKLFPTRCYEYLVSIGFKDNRSPDPLFELLRDQHAVHLACKDLADACLYQRVHDRFPTEIFADHRLKITERLFNYFEKDELRLYLSLGFYPPRRREHPCTTFMAFEIFSNHLSFFGFYRSERKRVVAHIQGLYELAELDIPVVIQLLIDRTRNIKIDSSVLAVEPLWPTDFCMEWLQRGRIHRYNYSIQICFYILFCLSHGMRTIRQDTHRPLLREKVFAECCKHISMNMKAQIPVEWFENLQLDDLTYYEAYLLEMAGNTAFTPIKRKTKAAGSKAKRVRQSI